MIRGTSHDQDSRFKDKAQKMLLQSKWPDKYDIKIDLSKIDFEALKTWIQKRTTQLLGYEDDIVSGTIVSLLQQFTNKQQKPNAKKIHVAMSGFLTTHTLTFMSQLWDWLDQAQKSKSGISKRLLDDKKQEQQGKKHKLKEINERKDKMKNYKFDIIKNQIGRQRESSLEAKRKDRRYDKHQNQEQQKKKKKNKGRSQSRDKKKVKKYYDQSQSQERDFENRERLKRKKKEKSKRKRSYSRSRSSGNNEERSKSRSRSKQRRRQNKRLSSASESRQNEQKKEKEKEKKAHQQKQRKKEKRKRSSSRSESSEVISSSQDDN